MPRIRVRAPFLALWDAVTMPGDTPLVELPGWWSRQAAEDEARIVAADSGRSSAGRVAVIELRRLRLDR